MDSVSISQRANLVNATVAGGTKIAVLLTGAPVMVVPKGSIPRLSDRQMRAAMMSFSESLAAQVLQRLRDQRIAPDDIKALLDGRAIVTAVAVEEVTA